MRELEQWLARLAKRRERRLSIEAALLGGDYFRYALRRLVPFFWLRGAATISHVVEFTILINLFSQRSLLVSVALSNLTAILSAFWWGAQEELRRKLRSDTPEAARQRLRAWLSRAMKLALGALVIAPAITLWHGEGFTALDGYAAALGLRLALEIVVRTYYSGVYAERRIYRPVALLVAIEPTGLVAIALSWRWLGEWSFPVGLMATSLLSQGVALHYTLRAYRVSRVPVPLLRVRAPRRSPATDWREVLSAGAANLSSRLGAALVLAGLLRVGLSSNRLDAFTFALHLTSPLVAGAANWGRIFYHDWLRLGDELHGGLRRQLDRRLPATALLVGAGLWAMAFGLAWLLFDWRAMKLQLLSLLPLMLSASYLTARQLREFALGQFHRVTLASLFLCASAALAMVLGGPGDAARWNLLLGGLVAAATLALALSSARQPAEKSGLSATLLAWRRALSIEKSPLRVGWARATTPQAAAQVAARVALQLGTRGAVVAPPGRSRLLWFERSPQRFTTRELVLAAAGKLSRQERLPQAADGAAALKAAASLLGPALNSDGKSLQDEFRRAFPDGLVADLSAGKTDLGRLPPRERRQVWVEALRVARRGRAGRSRSPLEVTAFHPAGEIRLVFVAPRSDEPRRTAWRHRVAAANWHASRQKERGVG